MAAKTPTNVKRYNMGSANLLVATFSDLDDGDTWASGLSKEPVREYWFQDTDNPTTQGSVGAAVAYSSGSFTFYPAEDDKTGKLFVMIGAAN